MFTRKTRMEIMLALTASFFVVELVVGYMTRSVALVADSFHMLSDVLSLIIGLNALRYAKKEISDKNTYGWARAEVLGALINGVFLLSLCMTIFIEAIQRFFELEEIRDPVLLLTVGAIGLAINLLGLLIFHEHGHGHSHSDEDTGGHLNMKGVFLHILGDALGSVAVIVSALVVWLAEFPERHYIDPILSLLITGIILSHTIPLVRNSSFVLLQGIPDEVDPESLRSEIVDIPGVFDIHELHVWQLADDKLIASLHVTVGTQIDYMVVAEQIKQLFHKVGVHSTTVQPEYLMPQEQIGDQTCLIQCVVSPDGPDCSKNVCCGSSKTKLLRRKKYTLSGDSTSRKTDATSFEYEEEMETSDMSTERHP